MIPKIELSSFRHFKVVFRKQLKLTPMKSRQTSFTSYVGRKLPSMYNKFLCLINFRQFRLSFFYVNKFLSEEGWCIHRNPSASVTFTGTTETNRGYFTEEYRRRLRKIALKSPLDCGRKRDASGEEQRKNAKNVKKEKKTKKRRRNSCTGSKHPCLPPLNRRGYSAALKL